MRSGEGDVRKERTLVAMVAQKVDRRIGEQGTRKADSLPYLGEFAVRAEVDDRNLRVVRHSAEHDVATLLEAPEPRLLPVVPFPGGERRESATAEQLAQSRLAIHVHGNAEEALAGVEHGATGHANRAALRSETVRAPKTETVSDDAVDVGRADVRVAVGSDRVRTLIVSKQQEDVGLRGNRNGDR